MLGAALAVVVVLGFANPEPNPTDLVNRLGSLKYSERERAEAALSGLGKTAIPALRAAKSARDLEIRTRAAAILDRIEDSLLIETTSISLSLRDVRMADALRSINVETGLALATATDGDPAWAGRRFSVDPGTPLPFWKAVDALCEAGKAHYALGGPTLSGQGPAIFSIGEGQASPTPPTYDHGPFRVQLAGSFANDDAFLAQARVPGSGMWITPRGVVAATRGPASPPRQFSLQLLVAAEPRLSIAPSGPARVTEAFDEAGRSLVGAARPSGIQHSSGYFGMNPSPVLRVRVDLAHPEGAGQRIKRIRGRIPVAVATRKPDPLVVPLDRPSDRAARNDEVAITVREIRPARQGQRTTIELGLKNVGAAIAHADGFEGDVLPYRPESPLQQIEVLDAEGRPLPWSQRGSLYNGEETILTMTIPAVAGSGPPATIRHFGMIRGNAEIPFEFRDIPMP